MIRIDCRHMCEEDKTSLINYLDENVDSSLVTHGLFQLKKNNYYIPKNKPYTDDEKKYIFDIYDTIENKKNTVQLCKKNDIHLTPYLLTKLLNDRNTEPL